MGVASMVPRLQRRLDDDGFSEHFLDDDRTCSRQSRRARAPRAILSTSSSPTVQRTCPTPPAGIATTTRPTWPTRSCARLSERRLLTVEKPREADRSAPPGPTPLDEPDAGRRQRAEARSGSRSRRTPPNAVMKTLITRRAEESRAAVIEIVVEAAVEVLEDPAEEQRDHQEQEAHGGNREKDRERVQL